MGNKNHKRRRGNVKRCIRCKQTRQTHNLWKSQLACGVGVYDSDWIILVEGRADVINLLRAGYDNAIAIEGAKIDETILKLTQGKRIIAFIDGDKAGDLILKELQGLVKIDKVYRAPTGREVEECTPLEILEILKDVGRVYQKY